MMRPFLRLSLLLFLAAATPLLRAQRERLSPDEIEYVEKTWPGTTKTATGMRYLIRQKGDGPMPKSGERVGVLYVGSVLRGVTFDKLTDPAHPLVFRVGRGEVIEGWDEILPRMRLHEKRIVIIPAELAYGSRGRAPLIPRDAALVFEMELVSIQPE